MLKASGTLKTLATTAAVGVVYFGVAKLGLTRSLAVLAPQVSVVWPATGLALAAVFLLGYRVWPGITVGAFLANLLAEEPLWVASGIAVGNTLEALVGASLLRRIGFQPGLDRLRHALGLVVLAALLSTTISASIGAACVAAGIHGWQYFGWLWKFWWLGDTVGNLVVAPALLLAASRPHIDWIRERRREALVLAAALVAVCAAVFLPRYGVVANYPLAYGVFPVVLWAALRFGPVGSVTATCLVWIAALTGTLAGLGPFSLARGHDSLVLLQSFIGILAATSLVIAGATAERQQALDSMQALNQTLEIRVADRSAELERRAVQLRALASQLTQVEQRERRRLATLLHDHLQQTLVAARLHVDHVRRRDRDEDANEGLTAVGDLLEQAITASRSLAVELSPPVLHDAGLVPALHWLARTMQTQYGLNVEVEVSGPADRVDDDLGAFVFHSVRELLFNVVKHAGTDRARVAVSTDPSGRLKVRVADSGVGFDRAGPAETAVDRFGLLSIRERLEQLGGEFALDTAPGRGVSVTLGLPPTIAADAAAASPRDARLQEAAARLPAADALANGIRVLLVDDHRIVREGLRLLLEEQADMNVVGEAADGVEALDVARRVRPDVVLMDVNMPRMNGIECTRRIKQEHPELAVIALSFHQDRDVAESMREAGAESYVRKDGPPDELCDAIRSIRFPAAPAARPPADIREA